MTELPRGLSKKPGTSVERERVQESFSRLRDAIGREFGWAPTARRWVLPFAAFAVGVAMALRKRTAGQRGRVQAGVRKTPRLPRHNAAK